MSESNKTSNLVSIIVALIGCAGIIGSALITKGYFDKKIEEEYMSTEDVKEGFTSNLEVKKLRNRILELEQKMESKSSKINTIKPDDKKVDNTSKENKLDAEIENHLIQVQKIADWEFGLYGCERINNDVTELGF